MYRDTNAEPARRGEAGGAALGAVSNVEVKLQFGIGDAAIVHRFDDERGLHRFVVVVRS